MPVTIARVKYVTATEAAELLGHKRDTFTYLVSRGRAPAAAIDHGRGTKLWRLSEVQKYARSRPGKGWRKGTGAKK